jgi:predicted dehydrogenase
MRVGIAGTGSMGSTHAAGWVETGAELAGFVAETAREAERIASQYGVQTYPDFASMLHDVDVVDICTPTPLHHRMTLQAAAAGKHIICEKPLGRTAAQAREMIAACQAAGVTLLVAHVVRYFPEYVLAKESVARGEIGQPGVIRLSRGSFRPQKAEHNWFLDSAQSGGILMDMMIHDYDYARWIAGEVESVFAKSVAAGTPEAPIDYGLAILRHRSGALSHIAGAWAYPPTVFRTHLEIAGDGGLIEFDSDASAPIVNLIARSGGSSADVGLPASPVAESPYTTQIKEFYAVLCGEKEARVTASDGLAAVQIAEAAIQSAASGKAVMLESPAEIAS